MNNLIKNHLIVFVSIFLFPIFTNAAISSQSNLNQDSTLVITYVGSYEEENHVFHKGDKIIYSDGNRKNKVEIIGFKGEDVVVKDIKSGKIKQLNLKKVRWIKEYSKSENGAFNILKGIGIAAFVFIAGFSATVPETDFFGPDGTFIILMILFIPIVLIVWGISAFISHAVRPKFRQGRNFRFDVKG